ncbi:MAG: hypothetical protein AAGE01_14210 [Pseudomonadota bacterium]
MSTESNLNTGSTERSLLRSSSILWLIWGFVHAMAGTLILLGDTQAGFQAIADAVEPAELAMVYPAAVGGILDQHAWNLLWFGVLTFVGAIFIWRENLTAIWVTALVGGLADIGYFVFVDLAGFARFVPGTIMTIVSATAIVLSGLVWFRRRTPS